MRSGSSDPPPAPDHAKTKARRRRGSDDLRALSQQRDDLYDEARRNPESDADEMVKALLLSAIRDAQRELQESEKADEANRRSREQERRQQRILARRAAGEAGADFLPRAAEAAVAEARLREVQSQIAEVARIASDATAQPSMDPMAVYNKIAEIIGLQYPSGQDPQPRNEGE